MPRTQAHHRRRSLTRVLALLASGLLAPAACLAHGDEHAAPATATTVATPAYVPASTGTRVLELEGVTIRMLAEAGNLGRGDIEVGELVLPVAYGEGAPHAHGSLELFYVVEGVLGHEVNGVLHRLVPGTLGFVKPGDQVRHAVLSDTAVKAVVIWVPGGEADRLVEHAGFSARPLP